MARKYTKRLPPVDIGVIDLPPRRKPTPKAAPVAEPTVSANRLAARERARLLQAQYDAAQAAGNVESMFPTREPLDLDPDEPAPVDTDTNGPLMVMVQEYNGLDVASTRNEGRAFDQRVNQAIVAARIKQYCRAHKLNFRTVAEAFLEQSWIVVQKMASIGSQPDVVAAMQIYRDQAAARNRALRLRQQAQLSLARQIVEGQTGDTPQPPKELTSDPAPEAAVEAAEPAEEVVYNLPPPAPEPPVSADPLQVVDGIVSTFTVDLAVQHVHRLVERFGSVVVNGHGELTVDRVLSEFDMLDHEAQVEFLRRANEHIGEHAHG